MILHAETLVYDGRQECEGITARPLARSIVVSAELPHLTRKQRALTKKLSRKIERPPRHKLGPYPFNDPPTQR